MATSAGTDVAVRVIGLGKSYRISHFDRASTLREAVENVLRSPATRVRHAFRRGRGDEIIWALRDASFEVEHGRVLGIIGRNGAGKSTLLKILSRITDPTEGYADVNGRLASLLEVGTGFHPELTGRDNIYLNGAILGMRRSEIRSKFDRIVEFAGVEKFIDTPVKRYSSGMYMRLAFAVAAHLDPDILVVDEVLAVGDAEFQERSLGKMREVTSEGRTVLFVSHNMASIRALCERAILLESGRITMDGDVDPVVSHYLSESVKAAPAGYIAADVERLGTGEVQFQRVELLDLAGSALTRLFLGQGFTVAMTFDVARPVRNAVFEVGISTLDGFRVTTSFSTDAENAPFRLEPGEASVSFDVEAVLLPGHYTLDLGVHHAGTAWTIDYVEHILDFEVLNTAETGGDRYPTASVRGYVRPSGRWHAPGPVGESEPLKIG